MSSAPLVSIRNLEVSFRTENSLVTAVKGISLDVRPGEILGIVGESGSGKSVTALSLMRLIAAPGDISGGQILYQPEGRQPVDILKLPPAALRSYRGHEIAMIFQEPMTSLNPLHTCGRQVAEAIRLHKKVTEAAAKKQTLALFEKVRIPRPGEAYDKYPHELSGGQKQRVMIAMAISCGPRLLIADEPTTALDVTVQKTILGLLRELQEELGMSVIFITHDLGVIAEIASRVAVMYKGEIVEEGAVKDIFEHPQHPYTKGLLACRPPLDLRLRRLPVVKDFTDEGRAADVDAFVRSLVLPEAEQQARDELLKTRPPLLKVEGLSTWFPGKRSLLGRVHNYTKAVDDVSFEVREGETLGLVGESGCGKTTLSRTLLRLVEPTHGSIRYRGKDLCSLNAKEMRGMRKHMQLIFQDPYSSLNPRLTVGQAILEPMQVHGLYGDDRARKEKVLELLEKVNLLPEHYHRYPHEFSGGQRQRVVIARALAVNPEFIICDESVSALDVSVQAQVLNLLTRLQQEFNFTYIFISHNLSVVHFMSDRMMVMNKGKIEEIGHAGEIYHHPRSAYTRELIAAIPGR
ncbi:ABC transporter ATP-binding protein [Chitinophaga sp. GCM10012297]|uniref:ABC transporter ATP-binding protein n=1 Tax=Chitinophaga chungangae TaxID=2821488 RepID=A0ABS3Y9D3_9BACT|nr:ABC transporter ATP-binding protein [Chitinophaga chungangae]MBO9150744.1 ABC transporter ATP-binding protein [Chitinophaga chungangae]